MRTIYLFSLAAICIVFAAGCEKEKKATGPDPAERVTIRIRADQKGASVRVDGKKLDNVTPCEFVADNRGHIVEISYPGFETVWRRIPPSSEPDKLHAIDDLELKPKTVPIILETTPPGAFVSVDGQDHGTTPAYIKDLRLGEHDITFKFKAGFAPVTMKVEAKEGQPLLVTKEMDSILGSIRVFAQHDNCKVYLDGAYKGETQNAGVGMIIREIEEGNHLLVLKKDGFHDLEEKFVLKRKEQKPIRLPQMVQLPGTIIVKSEPSGAIVIRNQQQLGKTPLTMDNLKDESITLKLTLPGHDAAVRSVKVVPGLKKTVTVTMVKNVGSMTLKTKPPGCDIFVDGKKIGTTVPSGAPDISKMFEYTGLRPGPHMIRISKAGFTDRSKRVIVQKGENLALKTVTLKEQWLPTHFLKTKKDTKILRVKLLNDTKDGHLIEVYKNGGRVTYEVKTKNIALWRKIE